MSAVCALHCALAPLALAAASAALLPGAVLGVFRNPWLEWGLVGTALLLGAWSLARARQQRPVGARPPLLLGAGFTALIGGRLLEGRLSAALTLPAIVLGGASVALAHLELRRRLQRAVRAPGEDGV